MIGKDIIKNPTPTGIIKPVAKAVAQQTDNYYGLLKGNVRLKQDRQILRDLVAEKKRKKGLALDQQVRSQVAEKNKQIAELMKTNPVQAAEMLRKLPGQILRQRVDMGKAGKPEHRKAEWNKRDTLQLMYGGPAGIIGTAIRHKRQNDINDLEDEYKQLESEGYGIPKKNVFVRISVRPLKGHGSVRRIGQFYPILDIVRKLKKNHETFKYLNGINE